MPIVGCPLGANADRCASQRQASLNNDDRENLIVVKIDHTINAKESALDRFQQDTSLQAAYTDPIHPIFNSFSPQPQRVSAPSRPCFKWVRGQEIHRTFANGTLQVG